MNRRMWRIVPPLIAGLMLLGFVVTSGVAADVPYTRMRALRVTIMTLIDGVLDVDGATTLNSTLDVDGLVTANGGAVVAGQTSSGAVVASTGAFTTTLAVGTFGSFTAATGITVTAGCTLTPLGTYQPIAAAGNLGFSDIAADSAGRLLILTNTSDTSIVITDTSTTMLSGDITLTQYDTLTLISDGTNWLEVAHSTN